MTRCGPAPLSTTSSSESDDTDIGGALSPAAACADKPWLYATGADQARLVAAWLRWCVRPAAQRPAAALAAYDARIFAFSASNSASLSTPWSLRAASLAS